ncbi:unnamed protein product [Candidula unifasciata]|uniref:Thioredoxin domain-containing protein n=1 Tax=Candidula unifasciata TaxID=100452 RepID=A0A8S4AAF5_9EUPU|nr:unnamed protein product [Candidula unifasciata]
MAYDRPSILSNLPTSPLTQAPKYPARYVPDVAMSPQTEVNPSRSPRRYSAASTHQASADADKEEVYGEADWENYWDPQDLRDLPPPGPKLQPEPIYENSMPDKNKFLGTHQVMQLDDKSYSNVITHYEKTLVMFYNPFQCDSVFPGMQFASAASANTNKLHRYASVDCSTEKELCLDQKILKTPVFKLYSNGYIISNIGDPDKFNADQMRMLVTMTPVLNQPRQELAKVFSARS